MLWIPRPWNPCRFFSSFLLSWASHTKSGTLNTNPISMKWKATELTTPIGFKSTECVPEDTKPISKKLIATTSSFSLIDSGPKKRMWPNPVIIGEIIAPNLLYVTVRCVSNMGMTEWNLFISQPTPTHCTYYTSTLLSNTELPGDRDWLNQGLIWKLRIRVSFQPARTSVDLVPQDPIEDDLELPSVVQAVHRTILLQQKADQRHRLSLQSEEVRVL